jgi:predicted rRNA methylase YqxC with S4 and FtsJ domains
VHQRVLAELQQFVQNNPALKWQAVTPSPLTGPAGNIEFLALIEKTA